MVDWKVTSKELPERNKFVLGAWLYPNGIMMTYTGLLKTDGEWVCYTGIPPSHFAPAPQWWAYINAPEQEKAE